MGVPKTATARADIEKEEKRRWTEPLAQYVTEGRLPYWRDAQGTADPEKSMLRFLNDLETCSQDTPTDDILDMECPTRGRLVHGSFVRTSQNPRSIHIERG